MTATAALPPVRSGVRFEPATRADDAGLRALLRATPMPGAVRLVQTREPDFFLADAALGSRVDTLVARAHPGGPPVAVLQRAEREVWLGGRPVSCAYLGGLRVHPEHRGRGIARAGWAAVAEWQTARPADLTLCALTDESHAARRVFVERPVGSAAPARFVRLADVRTLALAVPRRPRATNSHQIRLSCCPCEERQRQPAPPHGGVAISRCSARAEEIAASPSAPRNDSEEKLPDWVSPARLVPPSSGGRASAAGGGRPPRRDGGEPRDLAAADAPTLLRQSDTITDYSGSAAVWDPSAVRQTLVAGYGGLLGRVRPLASAALRLLGRPGLPRVGEALRTGFAVGLGAASPRALDAVLDAALAHARTLGLDWLLVGFDALDPLLPTAARRPHVAYRSALYELVWPGAEPSAVTRPVHVELARL